MASAAAIGMSSSKPCIFASTPKVLLRNTNAETQLSLFSNRRARCRRWILVCRSSDGCGSSSSSGLYSAQIFQLTPENVDRVLEDVRPYLIADGGNVDVVSVQDGVISLRLQGACESCPSSSTTMKMGIEKVLKEKFGDAVQDIRQVYDDDQANKKTTVEAVNRHLDILRPAIKNYGGDVQVVSVEESGNCIVNYVGPESIGSGISAAIKEKFPDIVSVVFTS